VSESLNAAGAAATVMGAMSHRIANFVETIGQGCRESPDFITSVAKFYGSLELPLGQWSDEAAKLQALDANLMTEKGKYQMRLHSDTLRDLVGHLLALLRAFGVAVVRMQVDIPSPGSTPESERAIAVMTTARQVMEELWSKLGPVCPDVPLVFDAIALSVEARIGHIKLYSNSSLLQGESQQMWGKFGQVGRIAEQAAQAMAKARLGYGAFTEQQASLMSEALGADSQRRWADLSPFRLAAFRDVLLALGNRTCLDGDVYQLLPVVPGVDWGHVVANLDADPSQQGDILTALRPLCIAGQSTGALAAVEEGAHRTILTMADKLSRISSCSAIVLSALLTKAGEPLYGAVTTTLVKGTGALDRLLSETATYGGRIEELTSYTGECDPEVANLLLPVVSGWEQSTRQASCLSARLLLGA
jgi:hypothetical protein